MSEPPTMVTAMLPWMKQWLSADVEMYLETGPGRHFNSAAVSMVQGIAVKYHTSHVAAIASAPANAGAHRATNIVLKSGSIITPQTGGGYLKCDSTRPENSSICRK